MKHFEWWEKTTALCMVAIVAFGIYTHYDRKNHPAPPKPVVITEEETPFTRQPGRILARRGEYYVTTKTLTEDIKQTYKQIETLDELIKYAPSKDAISLLPFCCEPPYPKDWNYCAYCGQHLNETRRERELQRLEAAEKGEKE